MLNNNIKIVILVNLKNSARANSKI